MKKQRENVKATRASFNSIQPLIILLDDHDQVDQLRQGNEFTSAYLLDHLKVVFSLHSSCHRNLVCAIFS